MSKYIDAEKLIAEIEKRKNILDVESPFGIGGRVELELVLDAIATLQQEQPEVDLEKELIQWHKRHFKKTGTYEKHSGFYLENSSQLDIARHFYELGLNARKEG